MFVEIDLDDAAGRLASLETALFLATKARSHRERMEQWLDAANATAQAQTQVLKALLKDIKAVLTIAARYAP